MKLRRIITRTSSSSWIRLSSPEIFIINLIKMCKTNQKMAFSGPPPRIRCRVLLEISIWAISISKSWKSDKQSPKTTLLEKWASTCCLSSQRMVIWLMMHHATKRLPWWWSRKSWIPCRTAKNEAWEVYQAHTNIDQWCISNYSLIEMNYEGFILNKYQEF